MLMTCSSHRIVNNHACSSHGIVNNCMRAIAHYRLQGWPYEVNNRSTSRTTTSPAPVPRMIVRPLSPLFISDSSSDESDTMAPASTQCIVPGTSKNPIHFTDGPVMLNLFEDYSEHCEIYLCEYHDKVPDNTVLPKLISGIECKKLHNAYLLDRAVYDVMTLNNFLNALQQHSFGPNWAINQAQKIKTMKQDGQPMNQWFVNIFAACCILTGLPEEIKDPELITFLIDAMDPGLCQALFMETHELSKKINAGTAKADDDETFAKWRSLVNKTDQQI